MKNFLKTVKNFAEDLLFPKNIHCICCGSEIFDNERFCLCDNCLSKLQFLDNFNYCKVCGTKITGCGDLCERCVKNTFTSFKIARAVFVYEENMVNIVHNLKYNNKQYLSHALSNLLFDFFVHHEELLDADIIIPVPLHKTKLKKRGYNQTELLLESFKEKFNVRFDVAVKIKETDSQRTKTAQERFENMKNCFEIVKPELIKNKKVLICDDVFTTGATCGSLARTLLKSGAKQVKCLTLCNTTKKMF